MQDGKQTGCQDDFGNKNLFVCAYVHVVYVSVYTYETGGDTLHYFSSVRATSRKDPGQHQGRTSG